LPVFAENEVAAAAGRAVVAVAAVPAQTDSLTDLEERHIGADGIDNAGDFVAWNPRIGDAGKEAELGDCVTVTNPAGLYTNANFSRTGLGEFSFH
jgi:hypothetical protein